MSSSAMAVRSSMAGLGPWADACWTSRTNSGRRPRRPKSGTISAGRTREATSARVGHPKPEARSEMTGGSRGMSVEHATGTLIVVEEPVDDLLGGPIADEPLPAEREYPDVSHVRPA